MNHRLLAPQYEALMKAINLQDDKIVKELQCLYEKGLGANTLPKIEKLRKERQALMGAKVWVLSHQKETVIQWLAHQLQKAATALLWRNSGSKLARTAQK